MRKHLETEAKERKTLEGSGPEPSKAFPPPKGREAPRQRRSRGAGRSRCPNPQGLPRHAGIAQSAGSAAKRGVKSPGPPGSRGRWLTVLTRSSRGRTTRLSAFAAGTQPPRAPPPGSRGSRSREAATDGRGTSKAHLSLQEQARERIHSGRWRPWKQPRCQGPGAREGSAHQLAKGVGPGRSQREERGLAAFFMFSGADIRNGGVEYRCLEAKGSDDRPLTPAGNLAGFSGKTQHTRHC